MDIVNIRRKLENLKGARDQVRADITKLESQITRGTRELHRQEKARQIVREVGVKTQSQLSYNISEITSMAMESVIKNDPYKIVVNFVERRNKTECDILFKRDNNLIEPLSAGGGAVDVAAFAFRVAAWAMNPSKGRNVLILDEPFKHLKGEAANIRMLEMVREVSKRMGLQIIMVGDERVSREALLANTDKLFEVKLIGGKSKTIV